VQLRPAETTLLRQAGAGLGALALLTGQRHKHDHWGGADLEKAEEPLVNCAAK